MPTIPRYNGPQVQQEAIRPVYQRPSSAAGVGMRALGAGIDQLTDAVDKIDQDVQSREAFAADNNIKAKWLETDAQLRQKYRGANAGGYVEEVAKFWDTARQESSQALSPRAQALVSKSLGTAALQAKDGAQRYFTQETERSQDEAFNASQLTEIQRGAAGGPAVAMESSKLLRQRNAQQAAIRGWGPEQLDQANVKTLTALHTNVIQDLMQSDPKAAGEYFTANKGEIDGTRHAEIGKMLTTANAANDGEVTAGEVWSSMGPKGYNDPVVLDKMQEAIRQKFPNDPDRRKAALAALQERTAAFNATQAETNASSVNNLMDLYSKTHSLGALMKSPEWSAIPGAKRVEIENHILAQQASIAARGAANAQRQDAEEARAERRMVREQAGSFFEYSDPEKLAGMTRTEVQALLPSMGRQYTENLLQRYDAIQKKPEKIVEAKIDDDDFKQIAQTMGLKPFAAKSEDEKAQLGLLKYRVEHVIDAAQNEKGKALTRDEKGELMRKTIAQTVTTSSWFGLSSNETPLINLPADQVDKVQIPANTRPQVLEALKEMAKRNPGNPNYAPTERNMIRLYVRKLSRDQIGGASGNALTDLTVPAQTNAK